MFEEEEKIYFPITIDEEKADNQNMIKINNIPVYFPYEPYEAQKNYMEKVISTLNNKGSISALESPTGTGKTLCLLCAVLAWVKENKLIIDYHFIVISIYIQFYGDLFLDFEVIRIFQYIIAQEQFLK